MFRKNFQQRHLAAVVHALLIAALGLFLHSAPLGRGLINSSYNFLLYCRGKEAAPEATIVYLDEKSHEGLQQPLNAPWDRKIHAALIDRLTAAGAKAIVMDIVFSDPSVAGPEADEVLSKSIKASGKVVLAVDYVPAGSERSAQALPPIDPFLDNAAGIGSVAMWPNPDLVVRIHTPDEEFAGGFILPSLAWATAEFVGAPVTTNEVARKSERWMNYYGPPSVLNSVSYADALDPGRTPDGLFRDKLVFVGSRIITKFAGERKDEYVDPFSYFLSEKRENKYGAQFAPGVAIQATACLNLVRQDWWSRLPLSMEKLIVILVGLGFGFGITLIKPLPSTVTLVLAFAILFGVSYAAVTTRLIWFPLFLVAVQICAAVVLSVAYNSIHAYVQKRLAEQTLSLYLSPKLVKKYSAESTVLKPGAEKQVVTLFFSDIEDFTAISEGMDSDDLATMMNQYFETAVAQCIHKSEGTVVKYIGDAIFAFWNAPEQQADHALRACQAALGFRQVQVTAPDGRKLHTRIGIHTGEANVGNFGSVERVDYTALGKHVNLASRLEGLNKFLGTECLVSGAARAGCGDHLITRSVGSFRLKGFETPVEVFELVGLPEEAESSREWREAFEQAMQNYRSGDFVLAELGFRRTIELKPMDGPATYYLEKLVELAGKPVPGDWTGETMLKEK